METKLVRVPFEVELAKRIQNKECEGKIVTRDGRSVRIVCWDKINNDYPVIGLVETEGKEENYDYTSKGEFVEGNRRNLDLMLEIPEYMTFKDGDIIAFNECETVLIVKGTAYKNGIGTLYCDCYAVVVNGYLYVDSNVIINRSRFATETEKQKLIDALKESKDTKAKEYLKRFFGIDYTLIIKPKYEFKPFDKVLARHGDECQWGARFFDRMYEGDYACTDSVAYKQCIPYNDQTAHLLGTTEDYNG